MPKNIPQLIATLGSSDPTERSNAAEQLSRLGPDARDAAVALVRACGDEAEEVCQWAVAALEELGPPSVSDLGELTPLLGDTNADVGYWAATLLGRPGAEAAAAASGLAAALSGPADIAVRQRAAWALGKIGPAAAEALDALKQTAADDDPRLARLSQRAIDQIGR